MAEQQMSPEQIAELKEKIKNMSPEELREFQKKQCIFCHIVAGKVQSKKIFEDDRVLAILDINPANPGHILILPKEHYSIMPQLPEQDLRHIFMVTKALSNSALRALGVQGTNIIVANGVAAGQKANHFMVHIIPRKENDGINFELPQRKISEKELLSIRDSMSNKLAEMTGKKTAASKVVEAEFIEEKQPKQAIPSQARKEKPKQPKPSGEKPRKPAKQAEKSSLDDISRMLNG